MTGQAAADMQNSCPPWAQPHLFGHEDAEERLLNAYRSGRCHQGWLLAGPQGIGKATLAYRFARFVLARPQTEERPAAANDGLALDSDHPVFHRIAARSHADLLVIEPPLDPGSDVRKAEITVNEARRTQHFFSLTAGEGGWRICIVDAADSLNQAAVNALLKIVEEPPPRSLFLVVAHSPGRLPATLRSRLIRLNLHPLSENALRQATASFARGTDDSMLTHILQLADGSPGRALQLLDNRGASLFLDFAEAMKKDRQTRRRSLLNLCDSFGGKGGKENYAIFSGLLLSWLADRAREQALSAGILPKMRSLAQVYEEIGHFLKQTNALNLDRRQTLADAFERINAAITD